MEARGVDTGLGGLGKLVSETSVTGVHEGTTWVLTGAVKGRGLSAG